LLEAIELGHLLSFAETIVVWGHRPAGMPRRALAHRPPQAQRRRLAEAPLAFREDGRIRLDYKPVSIIGSSPRRGNTDMT